MPAVVGIGGSTGLAPRAGDRQWVRQVKLVNSPGAGRVVPFWLGSRKSDVSDAETGMFRNHRHNTKGHRRASNMTFLNSTFPTTSVSLSYKIPAALVATTCIVGAGMFMVFVPDAEAVTAVQTVPVASDGFATVFSAAADRAFKGGVAGFSAGVLQVGGFMWLRTSMNYQYVNGGNLQNAIRSLWEQGGVRRFYQGVGFAIVQAPLSRFGDTAANAGVLLLLSIYAPETPLFVKTAAAASAAASWRMLLTPIDTLKTTRQVQGEAAYDVLWAKVRAAGPGVLYAGALASFAASWVGNYPWYTVYNALQESIPAQTGTNSLLRNAFIGFCASAASDTVSNSLRVVKTVRQTSPDPEVNYFTAGKRIVDEEGVSGLLGRGLTTRLLTNGLQGMLFSVAWKLIEEKLGVK